MFSTLSVVCVEMFKYLGTRLCALWISKYHGQKKKDILTFKVW